MMMLYNDPHPIHELMADEIGATMKEADHGGPLSRLRTAVTSTYEDTVVLEGGMPLIEGAIARWTGRVDKLIMLAADETLLNQKERLPYYGRVETTMHDLAMSQVDGVIAVSPDIAQISEYHFDTPAVVCRPFVEEMKAMHLRNTEPDLDGESVLCVAENRPSFDLEALERAASDYEITFVGKGTESLEDGLGYVDFYNLIRLYKESDLLVMPALAGSHPMSPVESMTAGVPAIVTENTGTADIVDHSLVCECTEESMRDAVENYFEKSPEERRDLGERMRYEALRLNEEDGRKRFAEAYKAL